MASNDHRAENAAMWEYAARIRALDAECDAREAANEPLGPEFRAMCIVETARVAEWNDPRPLDLPKAAIREADEAMPAIAALLHVAAELRRER